MQESSSNAMTQVVDLAFPLQAISPIPADHGYALYGAISNAVPELHELPGLGIHPIGGMQVGNRLLRLTERSRLVIRCFTDQIPQVIPLAGKSLGMAEAHVRIGVPQVRALQPSTALRSRLVTIKMAVSSASDIDETSFLAAIGQQLSDLGVSEAVIPTLGKRRTLRIKDKEVVGYEIMLEGLSAQESLDLQQHGVGGRRKMGCGVFLAARRE